MVQCGHMSPHTSLQPEVAFAVPRNDLDDGDEKGEAGSDGHSVQVVDKEGHHRAGHLQTVEKDPTEQEDQLPDIECRPDKVKEEESCPGDGGHDDDSAVNLLY